MDKSESQEHLAHAWSRSNSLEPEVQRLHQLTVLGRWIVVTLLWLMVGLPCLWGLRSEIKLWIEYFTWTAVRYTIAYNRLLSLGVIFCIGMTLAVLIWQSRNILFGLPLKERQRLNNQVLQIRQQGNSHPFWNWVVESRRG